MIIQVIGLPGAGKTTFAKELADRINAIHLNADAVRAELNKDLGFAILNRDMAYIRQKAQQKISTQFNEMISALAIFDKHWDTMGNKNQEVIWQYLKVLCVLTEKIVNLKE